MSQIFGKNAVLPKVAKHALLHLGKPPEETIGSVADAYILVVIARYDRNIWGGVVLHAGIAISMEIVDFARQ